MKLAKEDVVRKFYAEKIPPMIDPENTVQLETYKTQRLLSLGKTDEARNYVYALIIGNNLHIPVNQLIPNQYIYEKCLHETSWGGNGATRCCDSYIIHQRCAKKICDYVTGLTTKIDLPLDWWLNEVARDLALKVYWAEPTIVTQGSQNGRFTRSIQNIAN